jgi:N-acetylmuramoyl-L-alanine amidase
VSLKRIAIVVGHGPKDPGAVNVKVKESELRWNTDLAEKISAAIGPKAAVSVIFRRVEGVPPVDAVNATGADVTVELHLNAYNGIASGTEMIYYPGSLKGKTLALLLQRAAVTTLNLPDRGVKGPQAGGRGTAFLRGTRAPAALVESFFIDNDTDLQRGNERKDALAVAYADALLKFLA